MGKSIKLNQSGGLGEVHIFVDHIVSVSSSYSGLSSTVTKIGLVNGEFIESGEALDTVVTWIKNAK